MRTAWFFDDGGYAGGYGIRDAVPGGSQTFPIGIRLGGTGGKTIDV
jgi:hypothetical protein